MSVTTQGQVHILPVYRGDPAKAKSPELIARWNSAGMVIGDLSGGTEGFQCLFATGNIPFLYGNYGIITLDFFTWQATVSHTYIVLGIELMEESSPVGNFSPRMLIGSGTMMFSNFMLLPKGGFKVGANAAAMIQIYGDNVNTSQLNVFMSGRVLDERLL